jgi:hypothetical protein
MKGKTRALHITSHWNLVSDAWTADVRALERGIEAFPARRNASHTCHVALFEIAGDRHLHVNVTHGLETRPVKGWAGPGVSPAGFIHNRRFDCTSTDDILHDIRRMVFAARA